MNAIYIMGCLIQSCLHFSCIYTCVSNGELLENVGKLLRFWSSDPERLGRVLACRVASGVYCMYRAVHECMCGIL